MSHNIFEQLKLNSDKQIELLETISNRLKKEENKTLKMLSAIGPLVSGLLIAAAGWYFTNTHNKQEMKLAQIGVIEKFAPKLQDSVYATRLAALSTILSLDDEDLAIRTVSILDIEDRQVILSRLFNASVYTKDYSLMTRILRLYHGMIMPDEFQRTPLFIAIDNKDIETVKFLIEHDFGVNDIVVGQSTPLFEAVVVGDCKVIEFLLANKANPNVPFNEITPLMKAVDDGRLDVIKILLANKNVDVNFQNDSKLNALLLAVGFRVYQPDYPADKVVSLLLKAGAKLDVLSREGHSPIMKSVLNNYPESFKLLFDQKIADKDSSDLDACLIAATERGREKIVRYLLEHKISPKIKTAYGSTLLHLVKDNPEIAQLLLNAHLDVNAKNETGETVLHSLLAEVYYAIVTPLKREEYNKELNPGILKVLNLYIKAGIKVNESSEYNTFPLNVAALYRSSEIVETLLKNGANVNNQSGEDSTTALMDASRYGRSDNVAVLLKYHADKNIRNTKGQTALDVAEDFLKYYKTRGDSMESYMIQRLENTILALKE